MKYGHFESFEAFIESYKAGIRNEDTLATEGRGTDFSIRRKRDTRSRDVVEVAADITENLGTESQGAKHQHLIIRVTEVIKNDPDVAADIKRTQDMNERVFLSIRYGDRMGLPNPVPGVRVGLELKLRGEWIPKEKAYAHRGEQMSVLHFTHDPIGFVCTPEQCFS